MSNLIIIDGVMSSGKSETLLLMLEEAKGLNINTCLIKPVIDTRYGIQFVKSRSGKQAKADLVCSAPDEILWKLNDSPFSMAFIDECQFFDETFPFIIDALLKRKISVVASGLLKDSSNKFFGSFYQLFTRKHKHIHCTVSCAICSNTATRSFRLVSNDSQVLIGDSAYSPRCDSHCI